VQPRGRVLPAQPQGQVLPVQPEQGPPLAELPEPSPLLAGLRPELVQVARLLAPLVRAGQPRAEPSLLELEHARRTDLKPPMPPTAVRSGPVPTEPALMFTMPSAEWMSTMGSREAGASG
jgi:hypothetical protein